MDMTGYNGYTYGTDLQTVGYSTRGNSDDYYYDGDVVLNSGNIFAMTPEVGATGFWPSHCNLLTRMMIRRRMMVLKSRVLILS